ncbi:PREDICTED: general transcription factor IIF subunit 1 [Rhagoletis zephyria]|uniref:general transcription factor IIF subunit 1 n=1 Tax=Rhagoletis zephyria TaxID=28612 RepID=UPI0008119CEF|nr:PREDICTED: general transcription factor IIF subunit 1 [Rhagoletis zephyria]
MASTSKSGSASASSSSASASTSAPAPPTNVQEFNIRVPKNLRKKHHVMRFNATLNVDFAQWRGVKMERENNMKEFRGMEEDMPKFGAGSEYNRDLREEVRRKKFGIIAKKYRPEAQPWILKVGGKNGKKFKGIREGGVSENAAFYVFTHAPDGAIEAYPLNEWYNFQPIQRYKSLSAEEAEQEFGRRKKVMNYFSLMLRKRLKGDVEEEQDPEEVKVKGGSKKAKELKISEMDEWIDSDDESDSDEDEEKKKKEEDSDDDGGKKKGKKGQPKKPKKKRDVDDEAFEESDDGDEEGREMDYDTESSEDEPDPEAKLDKDMKSVAEEDALRKLLTSDEEDEEEEKKSDESDKEKDKNKEEGSNKEKKKTKKITKDEKKDSSSDFSSDSSDSEDESSGSKKKTKDNTNNKSAANNNSRPATPTSSITNSATKRNVNNSMPSDLTASENSNSPVSTPAKRTKAEATPMVPSTFAGVVNANNKDDYGITEEAVRRYLMRKPMTPTELLTKFKNKKTGVSSDRLVETMTQILKKINPVKQTIQNKMYLSIKPTK